MFKKKITPFACIIISLIVCATTFVGVYSHMTVVNKAKNNADRIENAAFGKYDTLDKLDGDEATRYNKLALLLSLIEQRYIREFDKDTLWDNVYRSLLLSIGDDYSQYLTAEEYNALIDSGNGNFVGIGVHATHDVDTGGVYIFGAMKDSPAEKAGITEGDIIIAVGDTKITAENYYEALDKIRGEVGTTVQITVQRGEDIFDVTVTRAKVASENVLYKKLDNDIGYMRILSFADETVSEEFEAKIKSALDEGCKSFIFDVRNNGGGYLDEIKAVLDLLLPEGPIINIVDKDGNTTTHYSDAECIDVPMTVLCNEGTASAAELFTAALRDYEMATIIGKTTFGKGTMQSTTPLSDGSALKLSYAYYNPPKNVSYDKIGIKPDYDIDLDEKWANRFFKMPLDEDAHLLKAIELLNSAK